MPSGNYGEDKEENFDETSDVTFANDGSGLASSVLVFLKLPAESVPVFELPEEHAVPINITKANRIRSKMDFFDFN